MEGILMTTKEFETITSGIAYHVERFYREKITKDELYEALQVQLGMEAFEKAREIMDKNK